MKLNFYFVLILFLLHQTRLFGQSSDSTISYIAEWQKGDIKKYKITKRNIEYRNGKETKNETNSYIARFEIKAADTNSYAIEYQYEDRLFSNTPELTTELKNITAKYNIRKVEYTTDEFGAFKEI